MATTATATPPIANAAITDTRGRFAWCELMTTDPTSAETFYSEVIGWKSNPMEGAEMPYTLFQSGERPIAGLMAIPPEAAAMNAPPAWLGYIEVPDVDATVAQVQALGGQVHMPPKTMEGAGRFAVLQDPQGASFAVITSAQPLEPETDPDPLEFSWHELTTTDSSAGITFYEQLFGWK
jgi:predicted enzyme related to lactoylglutathione lyase